jgi:phytoene dehydrogenase-like protein
MTTDVCIIGAGLSGLCCALELTQRNITWSLMEQSNRVGGRVASDHVEGFTLDRGFQVLLDAYPEAQRLLDYKALGLRSFQAGAVIRLPNGTFTRVSNPLERPSEVISTLLSPIGNMADKLKILGLRSSVCGNSLEDIFARPETTTLQALRTRDFSERMIEQFFRPFLGGIFLDRSLNTSSRMFEFVFRMFSTGRATLPTQGMSAVAMQIAARLDEQRIRLNAPVDTVQSNDDAVTITLRGGETIAAKAVVVATDGHAASRLTAGAVPPPENCSTACLYFVSSVLPQIALLREPILVLNGTGTGFVNNLCSPNAVVPDYAPSGQTLISVSTVGLPNMSDDALVQAVFAELTAWFGTETRSWRHLKTYRIEHALPSQAAPALAVPQRPVQLSPTLYVCGDHRDTASIQGAMVSGRRAAEAVAAHLKELGEGR